MRLFHFHRYKVSAVEQLKKVKQGYFLGGLFFPYDKPMESPHTEVLYVCECGKHKTEGITGHWTLEQLKCSAESPR